ncbi:20836_t:CDS:2, partial [Racocetra persica]
ISLQDDYPTGGLLSGIIFSASTLNRYCSKLNIPLKIECANESENSLCFLHIISALSKFYSPHKSLDQPLDQLLYQPLYHITPITSAVRSAIRTTIRSTIRSTVRS